MANQVSNQSNKIDLLVTNLLATLEEANFFSLLGQHMANELSVEKFKAYKIFADQSAKLISLNNNSIDGEILSFGHGPCGQVVKTKRPYFSNNVSRDPIFGQDKSSDIKNELIIPVIQDGIFIATLHFQNINDEVGFTREHINKMLNILNLVERPLNNLKLYISAKALNEVLLKKIEEKEIEFKNHSDDNGIVAKIGTAKENQLIGKSAFFINALKIAEKSAQTDVNVILFGEAGTGKASIAKMIHCRSSRKVGVCIDFDCSTYADTKAFEQDLFGTKGSEFVNGKSDKEGAIENAHGGTLILKRLEHLSVSLQAKLLLFLKDGSAQRLGDHRSYRANVRIIATTNVDLKKRVEDGLFREDLFYALGVIGIEMPALRNRQDDIEVMACSFLNQNKDSSQHKTLSPGVTKALSRYPWPGNIRELQNIMERAYILSDGAIIDIDHISEHILTRPVIENRNEKKVSIYNPITLEVLEKHHICETLEHLGGNKTKSAKMLGITVKTLYNKLHSYGMINAVSADA